MAKITKLEIRVNGGKELSAEYKMDGGKDVAFPIIAGAADAAEKAFTDFINISTEVPTLEMTK